MKHALMTALLYLVAACPATAGEHPFVGLYYIASSEPGDTPVYSLQQGKLNCAYAFAILRNNGDFIDYLLDKADFDKTGKPRYRVWTRGHCDMANDGVSDSCTTFIAPDMTKVSQMGNVYSTLTGDRFDFRFFETGAAAADSVAKHDATAGLATQATRCTFTEAEVQPFLTDQTTDLTAETWTPLAFPDAKPETNSHLRAVLSAMKVTLP